MSPFLRFAHTDVTHIHGRRHASLSKRTLSAQAKIGYSMIPVAVLLIALFIFFHIWYRKRRAAARARKEPPSPPTLEEGYNDRRSSKVCSMAAFAAPFPQDEARSASAQTELATVEEDKDSPIDEGSPFRLKRGNTAKRYSLTPDVTRSWSKRVVSEGRKGASTNNGVAAPARTYQPKSGGRGG
jgi:hypothetical protein